MVSSYTQLLERRYGERLDGDAKEFMDFIVDGAARMKQLIEDLLAYSRVGTRGREFRHGRLRGGAGAGARQSAGGDRGERRDGHARSAARGRGRRLRSSCSCSRT